MYSITVTITCNHKNQRLQITFLLLKTCNRLHVIMITDYNYNRSAGQTHAVCLNNKAKSEIRAFVIPCVQSIGMLDKIVT